MTKTKQICPICGSELTEQNVARKYWLHNKPLRLDYAGRVTCQKCMEWIENTEWD
jgi:ssDNA-binding Zn-finger/Zn-ribbon topoisomerase 1